jgi:hypothetical protein
MAAIARADVGLSARQCCRSDRIGIACGQRRRGRDVDRLLGGRPLRAYRDCVNGRRHFGKFFRDRSPRAVNGRRQHSKVVRDRTRRCHDLPFASFAHCPPTRPKSCKTKCCDLGHAGRSKAVARCLSGADFALTRASVLQAPLASEVPRRTRSGAAQNVVRRLSAGIREIPASQNTCNNKSGPLSCRAGWRMQ